MARGQTVGLRVLSKPQMSQNNSLLAPLDRIGPIDPVYRQRGLWLRLGGIARGTFTFLFRWCLGDFERAVVAELHAFECLPIVRGHEWEESGQCLLVALLLNQVRPSLQKVAGIKKLQRPVRTGHRRMVVPRKILRLVAAKELVVDVKQGNNEAHHFPACWWDRLIVAECRNFPVNRFPIDFLCLVKAFEKMDDFETVAAGNLHHEVPVAEK